MPNLTALCHMGVMEVKQYNLWSPVQSSAFAGLSHGQTCGMCWAVIAHFVP